MIHMHYGSPIIAVLFCVSVLNLLNQNLFWFHSVGRSLVLWNNQVALLINYI
jgi:hypothetical protein